VRREDHVGQALQLCKESACARPSSAWAATEHPSDDGEPGKRAPLAKAMHARVRAPSQLSIKAVTIIMAAAALRMVNGSMGGDWVAVHVC
jgi:hypothetical protein